MLKGQRDAMHSSRPHIPDFLRVEPDAEEEKYKKVCGEMFLGKAFVWHVMPGCRHFAMKAKTTSIWRCLMTELMFLSGCCTGLINTIPNLLVRFEGSY